MLLTPFPATAPRGEPCWLPGDCFVAIHFIQEATIRLNSRLATTSNAKSTTSISSNTLLRDSGTVDLVLSGQTASESTARRDICSIAQCDCDDDASAGSSTVVDVEHGDRTGTATNDHDQDISI